LVGHVGIDVHIDVVDAPLSLAMPAGTMPRSVSRDGVMDFREIETTPISLTGKSAAAFAFELID
jgi:hypothetical protein